MQLYVEIELQTIRRVGKKCCQKAKTGAQRAQTEHTIANWSEINARLGLGVQRRTAILCSVLLPILSTIISSIVVLSLSQGLTFHSLSLITWFEFLFKSILIHFLIVWAKESSLFHSSVRTKCNLLIQLVHSILHQLFANFYNIESSLLSYDHWFGKFAKRCEKWC